VLNLGVVIFLHVGCVLLFQDLLIACGSLRFRKDKYMFQLLHITQRIQIPREYIKLPTMCQNTSTYIPLSADLGDGPIDFLSFELRRAGVMITLPCFQEPPIGAGRAPSSHESFGSRFSLNWKNRARSCRSMLITYFNILVKRSSDRKDVVRTSSELSDSF